MRLQLIQRITLTFFALFCCGYGSQTKTCAEATKEFCSETNDTKKNCLQRAFDKIKQQSCKDELNTTRELWLAKEASFESLKKSCKADVASLCPDSLDSGKDFKVCLMMNPEKISSECKKSANEHIEKHLPGFNKI